MRTTGRVLVAVAVVVGSIVGVAAPASAALPGLEFIEVRGGSDLHDRDDVWGRCPEGKVAIGGGFNLLDSGGEATVDSLWPGWPGGVHQQLSVSAAQTDPFDTAWSLDGYALCV